MIYVKKSNGNIEELSVPCDVGLANDEQWSTWYLVHLYISNYILVQTKDCVCCWMETTPHFAFALYV